MHRRAFLAGLPFALAGCGAEAVWAPDDVVAAAAYRHDGPPALTLYTMKNTNSGNGAHTGLMINASQRVIFDPAGTFRHPTLPERNDVVYGITPRVLDFYISYHARETFYVVEQYLEVPAATAAMAFQEARAYGPVPKSQCTTATTRILRTLPGMGHINVSFFPDRLLRQFAEFPGVVTAEYRESDADNNTSVLGQFYTAPPLADAGAADR